MHTVGVEKLSFYKGAYPQASNNTDVNENTLALHNYLLNFLKSSNFWINVIPSQRWVPSETGHDPNSIRVICYFMWL